MGDRKRQTMNVIFFERKNDFFNAIDFRMSCDMDCLTESFSILQTRWPGLAKEQVEVLISNEFDHETTDELESIEKQISAWLNSRLAKKKYRYLPPAECFRTEQNYAWHRDIGLQTACWHKSQSRIR